jgi:hypothetical protein
LCLLASLDRRNSAIYRSIMDCGTAIAHRGRDGDVQAVRQDERRGCFRRLSLMSTCRAE